MDRYSLGALAAVVVVLLGLGIYAAGGINPGGTRTTLFGRLVVGRVLDRTGDSLVVQQEKSATIFTVTVDRTTRLIKGGRPRVLRSSARPFGCSPGRLHHGLPPAPSTTSSS